MDGAYVICLLAHHVTPCLGPNQFRDDGKGQPKTPTASPNLWILSTPSNFGHVFGLPGLPTASIAVRRLLIVHNLSSTPAPRPANDQVALKPDVPARRADLDTEGTLGHHPVLADDVPVAQVLPAEAERHSARSAGIERQLVKAAELLGRRRRRTVGERDVQLGNLGTGDSTRVGDGRGHHGHFLEEVLAASRDDVADRRSRLGGRGDLEVRVCPVGVR